MKANNDHIMYTLLTKRYVPIVNGTNVWPKYTLKDAETFVWDVNATQLCRTQKDDFRSDAIAYWMELFTTNEYPK
jgi:hypothetical protein